MYNQRKQIKEYLKKYKSITQREATIELSIERLASRISELKREGFPIVSKYETGTNRFGRPTRYKRYFYDEEAKS